MDILANIWNGPSRYVVIMIAVLMIAYIPITIIQVNKRKNRANQFVSDHPDAAKVINSNSINGTLTVFTVNGEAPTMIHEGAKLGFYLLPGESVVEVQFSWTRPGVLHKTVTTTVGPNKIKVFAEANKTYTLNYDKKAETYIFEESNK